VSQISIKSSYLKKVCKLALKEDLYPAGDITSNILDRKNIKKAKLISGQDGILGGLYFAKTVFKLVNNKIKFKIKKKEGSKIKKNNLVAIVEGKVKDILTGERVALNFLSHISGIATVTNNYVKKTKGKTKICCTRKTIPNLRLMQKYGVKLGGGTNHRFNLSDEFLIKDNHIEASGNIVKFVKKAIRNKKKRIITVEVDNLRQLKKIMGLKFERVLLDNMSPKIVKNALKIIKNKYETEVSGNINISNVKKYASTGVNRISIGKITHSLNSLDFKLEV